MANTNLGGARWGQLSDRVGADDHYLQNNVAAIPVVNDEPSMQSPSQPAP